MTPDTVSARREITPDGYEVVTTDVPAQMVFLTEEKWRYKIVYGGRAGMKSWQFARALLALTTRRRYRILCVREIQNSLDESVMALLEKQIGLLNLEGHYEIQRSRILGPWGSEFIFAGLRHNAGKLKSYEDVDICWVEEGAQVSEASWSVLLPTIRKQGSEIWCSFNPSLDSDFVWQYFVLGKPPGCKAVEISYLDNPWLPDAARIEADHLKETDLKAYEHVWLGHTKSALDGAIFAEELAQAEKDKRIGNVPRDRTRAIDTFWDLGFGDAMAIWFAQALPDGSIRVVDYLENSGKALDWYIVQLQQKGYLYGTHYLPHDGVDAIIHQRLTNDASMSVEMLMRKAGLNVRIAPKLHVTSRINAARTVFSSCWFDRAKCSEGIHALRYYQWAPVKNAEPDPRENAPSGPPGRAPLHSWASHGADAFCVLGVSLKTPPKPAPPQRIYPPPAGDRSWMA